MMLSRDPQVAPLIEVFELYMMHAAALNDMREPTIIATRAMLDSGLAPEMILTILNGAVQVAATETLGAHADDHATELRDHIGPWLMGECFNPARSEGDVAPMD
jgi:hypothetical protein